MSRIRIFRSRLQYFEVNFENFEVVHFEAKLRPFLAIFKSKSPKLFRSGTSNRLRFASIPSLNITVVPLITPHYIYRDFKLKPLINPPNTPSSELKKK
jgi:hypothetical protein